MNTNPDEAKLAMWLDDELAGDELASFEAWALSQPEHVAARDETRKWRALMVANIPASEEPPYPEFFNSRIAQAIREQRPKPAVVEKRKSFWQTLLMPLAACAGMVLAFWVGTRTRNLSNEVDVAGAPRAIPVEQIVYTPEGGVNAELITRSDAAAVVIVLDGVRAIPDSMDFSATTYVPVGREFDSTASVETGEVR
jgi:hypothetical protein